MTDQSVPQTMTRRQALAALRKLGFVREVRPDGVSYHLTVWGGDHSGPRIAQEAGRIADEQGWFFNGQRTGGGSRYSMSVSV